MVEGQATNIRHEPGGDECVYEGAGGSVVSQYTPARITKFKSVRDVEISIWSERHVPWMDQAAAPCRNKRVEQRARAPVITIDSRVSATYIQIPIRPIGHGNWM